MLGLRTLMLRQNALLRRFSSTQVVTLRYEDLVSDVDLSSEIEAAYGYDGTGFLTVSGVPGLEQKREALLPLAQKFTSVFFLAFLLQGSKASGSRSFHVYV